MSNNYELIIFDCDGTLIESENLLNSACSKVLAGLGYPEYTVSECLRLFHAISVSQVEEYLISKHDDFPVQQFRTEAEAEILQIYKQGILVHDDVREMLEYLREHDIPRCVASNGSKRVVLDSLEKTGLMKYFKPEHIYTYDMIGVPKPEPDLFLHAVDSFFVEPYSALLVEHSAVGVQAATAAGMDVALINRSNTGDKCPGDILKVIDKMTDLKEFL